MSQRRRVYSPQLQHKVFKWLTQDCQLAKWKNQIWKMGKMYRSSDLSQTAFHPRSLLSGKSPNLSLGFIMTTDLSAAFDVTHFLSLPKPWLQWLFCSSSVPFPVISPSFHFFLSPPEYGSPNMVTILNCIGNTIYLLILFIYLSYFLAAPSGMWDLSSPARHWTLHPLHWKCGVLTTEPLGKSNTTRLNHSPWE